MFILSLLSFFYGFLCLVIVLLVLIQRGKGNMGLGNVGGNNQMLFGSSGGQDVFQKMTWVCCVLLLSGSLVLALSRARTSGVSSLGAYRAPVSTEQQSFPSEQ